MRSSNAAPATPESHGVVIAVRGSVVNVCFPHELPALRQQLRAGRDDQAMIEVSAHLTTDTVRDDPVRDFTNRRSRWLY